MDGLATQVYPISHSCVACLARFPIPCFVPANRTCRQAIMNAPRICTCSCAASHSEMPHRAESSSVAGTCPSLGCQAFRCAKQHRLPLQSFPVQLHEGLSPLSRCISGLNQDVQEDERLCKTLNTAVASSSEKLDKLLWSSASSTSL